MGQASIGACVVGMGGSLKADKVGCEGNCSHAPYFELESNFYLARKHLPSTVSQDEDQEITAALAAEISIEGFTELARECKKQKIDNPQNVDCHQQMAKRPSIASLCSVAETTPIGLCCCESTREASKLFGLCLTNALE